MLKKTLIWLIILGLVVVGPAYWVFRAYAPTLVAELIQQTLESGGLQKVKVSPPNLSLSTIHFTAISGTTNELSFTGEDIALDFDLWKALTIGWNYILDPDSLSNSETALSSLPISTLRAKDIHITTVHGEVVVDGKLWINGQAIHYDGSFTFLQNQARLVSGTINAKAIPQRRAIDITAQATLDDDLGPFHATITQTLRRDSSTAEFYSTGISSEAFLNLLKKVSLPIPDGLKVSGGTIVPSGKISWGRTLQQEYWITLTELTGSYNKIPFRGGHATIPITIENSNISTESFAFLATDLSYGLPIENVEGRLTAKVQAGTNYSFAFSDLSLTALNTKATAKAFRIDSNSSGFTIPIHIPALELQELFSFYPESPVDGNGRIEVKIPVTVTAKGFSITDGTVRSLPPGGVLRYTGEAPVDNKDPAGFAISVLQDFRYSSLTADISLASDGEMLIKTALSGTNPKMNITRPVNVNLNIEQNLIDLLKSVNAVNILPANENAGS